MKLLRKLVSVLGDPLLLPEDEDPADTAVVEAALSAGLAVFLLRKLNLPKSEGGLATVGVGAALVG